MNPMVNTPSIADLNRMALRIRRHCVRMTHLGKSSHVGSALSSVDILAALYGKVLRVRPGEPQWPDRDRFILSKGHAAVGLYATLAESGFFPTNWLDTHYQDGSRLSGHVIHHGVPGIDASTGSLGHGLSIAAGLALAAKRDKMSWRTFALLSDGECDEGSTWEAALFAPHHRLDNLVAIIDYNKIQSLAPVKETLDLEPFAEKWRAFGWETREVLGHDLSALVAAFDTLPLGHGRPCCLIAHTVKGKGVSFMENSVLWHYRPPNPEELKNALEELGGAS